MTVRHEVMKLLAFGTVAVLLAACLAGVFAGVAVALRVLVAGYVALLPTCITYAFSLWSLSKGGTWQFAATLGGPGIRAMVTLAVALLLYLLFDFCHSIDFWIWIGISYLIALAAEVVLLLRAIGLPKPAFAFKG